MTILDTERLRLRGFRLSDLDDLFELYRDPEIRRYFPDGTRTYEQTREELEWFSRGKELSLWATELKEDGAFVGRCGLLPWTIEGRDEVEVAYMIASPGSGGDSPLKRPAPWCATDSIRSGCSGSSRWSIRRTPSRSRSHGGRACPTSATCSSTE